MDKMTSREICKLLDIIVGKTEPVKAEFLEVPFPKAQVIMTVCLFWFMKAADMKILPEKTKKRQRSVSDEYIRDIYRKPLPLAV